jgi:hypothetical protein
VFTNIFRDIPTFKLFYKNGRNEKLMVEETHEIIKVAIADSASRCCINGEQFGFITIVFDGVPAGSNNGLLGVSIMFPYFSQGRFFYVVLGVPRFTGRHTAKDVADLILQLMSQYNMTHKMILRGVADSAKNMKNVGKELLLNVDPCRCHWVATMIKHCAALESFSNDTPFPEAELLWKRIRRLVLHFKLSTQAMEYLVQSQVEVSDDPKKLDEYLALLRGIIGHDEFFTLWEEGTKGIRLVVSGNETRWDGWYSCLESLIYLERHITKYFSDERLKNLTQKHRKELTDLKAFLGDYADFWLAVDGCAKSLYHLHCITSWLQGETYPTSPWVVYLIRDFRLKISQEQLFTEVNKVRNNVKIKSMHSIPQAILKRFGEYIDSKFMPTKVELIATALYPPFKNLALFKSLKPYKDRADELLLSLWEEIKSASSDVIAQASTGDTNDDTVDLSGIPDELLYLCDTTDTVSLENSIDLRKDTDVVSHKYRKLLSPSWYLFFFSLGRRTQ